MRNEKGSALVFVLIIFAVMMILGTSVLSISLSETNFVVQDVKKIKADYTARSGAEAMASYLIEHPDKIQDTIDQTAFQPASGSLNGISFELTVEGSGEQFKITSSAMNGNVVSTVNLDMFGGRTNLMDFSLFSNEAPLTGKNHEGNVGTNANIFEIFSDNLIDGNAQVVNALSIEDLKNKVTGTVSSVTNEVTIPPIDTGLFVDILPDKEAHSISSGNVKYYKTTYIGKNANGGTFTASGGGTLHILVDQFGGNLDIEVLNSTKVIIYCEASSITFNGNPNLPVVMYVPNAFVTLSGGGNGKVTGQIVCNDYEGPTSNAFDFVALDLDMDDLAISTSNGVIKRQKYSK
ncbi:MAG: hypothetical protein K8R73_04115 [Clostridiales bacterium]|nr:hypothetical protein [Clostridiales bacterium]